MPIENQVLSLITPILYGLITSAMYYLGSRAKITKFLWSRYPEGFDRFMLCPACVGFWYGLIVALMIGWNLDMPYLGLPAHTWYTPIIVAISSVVVTPLFAAKHINALYYTGAQEDQGGQETE